MLKLGSTLTRNVGRTNGRPARIKAAQDRAADLAPIIADIKAEARTSSLRELAGL